MNKVDLRKAIEGAKDPVIIEGVCLLAVFDRLRKHPDLFIYIKRISNCGSWLDQNKCDVRGDIDEFIEWLTTGELFLRLRELAGHP